MSGGRTHAGTGDLAPGANSGTWDEARKALEELEAAERARLIDQIRALEDLKGAVSAAQARAAAALDISTRKAQAAAGLEAAQLGRGVAAQIALARRESPHRGTGLLGLARILTREMPNTLHALSVGVISEWRATILVRETACLSLSDRQKVDEQVAGNLDELEQLGDRKLIAKIRSLSYGLDPHAVVKRAARAVSERFVSCRPAPDTMTYVAALLPVSQGVGVYAALTREADRLRAAGDPRTKGQIMADTFVERTTGQARAEDARIELQLIMSDRALLHGILPAEPERNPELGKVREQQPGKAREEVREQGAAGEHSGAGTEPLSLRAPRPGSGCDAGTDAGLASKPFVAHGSEPAVLAGYGIVPAQWARDLIRGPDPVPETPDVPEAYDQSAIPGADSAPRRPDPRTDVWLRRLYVTPTTGQLTAMDSRARLVPDGLARLVAARDQICRTPWCGAPIRHYDHITPFREGGPTSAENIQGLCQACNQAKEAPGWEARPTGSGSGDRTCRDEQPQPSRHSVTTRTPTGHVYRSSAPAPPAFMSLPRVMGNEGTQDEARE